MRYGEIDRFRLVGQAVPVLEWNTIDFEARPSLGAGEKFAILSVRLAPGRSIGKYDYDLAGTTCLAMAIDDGPFRPETWEQRQAADVEIVHLLYKVKQADAPFSLNIALLDTNETVTLNSDGTVEGGDAGVAHTPEISPDTQPAPVEATAAVVEEKPEEPKPEPVQTVLPAVEKPKPILAGAAEQKAPDTVDNRPTEDVLITLRTGLKDKSRRVKDAAARSGWAFKADPADKPGKGVMWFEYTYRQSPGNVRGTFRLKLADNTSPKPVALIRGVISNSELKDFPSRYKEILLKGTDFAAPDRYQDFHIDISKGERGYAAWSLETMGVTSLWFDGVSIGQISEFTTEELLQRIEHPVKPANLALATDTFRVHETYGAYMPMWKVSEALQSLPGRRHDAQRTQSHLLVSSQNTTLTGFPAEWEELYGHSVVVLNNVPAKSVGLIGSLMLKQYVEDGGCLIMMGDTHGLVPGRWTESALGPVLPVAPRKEKDLVYSPKPLLLQPRGNAFDSLNWAEKPYTIYYHRAEVLPRAAVLLASGKIPLIVERQVGKGRIIVLLISMCGGNNPKVDGVPFWQWNDWPGLMAELIVTGSRSTQR